MGDFSILFESKRREFNPTYDLNLHNCTFWNGSTDSNSVKKFLLMNKFSKYLQLLKFFSFLGGRLAKISAITNLDYEIEFDKLEDPTVLETLKMCLQKDPEKRASIEELLTHAFLRLTKDSQIIETKTLEGFEREV